MTAAETTERRGMPARSRREESMVGTGANKEPWQEDWVDL
jgi:hypothetical protein